MYLGDQSKGRNNNLILIRTFAASLVVVSHSYPIVYGYGTKDFLSRISHAQIHFGTLAVCIFFLYSGFLISKSVTRRSGKDYMLARIIRLIPPLAAVTFLSTFILGPIFTELPVSAYFSSPQTYKYLGNSVFLLIHELPGVFTHNPYNATVNGSLWSLPVEMICYIVCLVFHKLGLLREKRMIWTLPLFILFYIAGFRILGNHPLLVAVMRPCGMFYAGMLAYVYRDRIRLMPIPALLCAAGFIAALFTGHVQLLLLFTLPYLLLYLAFGMKRILNLDTYGDFSYGMYLTGWPLAQCLVCLVGNRLPGLVQAAIVIVLSFFCGMALHYLVERPLRNKFESPSS